MRALSKNTHRARVGLGERLRQKIWRWRHAGANFDIEEIKIKYRRVRAKTDCDFKKTQSDTPREDPESTKDF